MTISIDVKVVRSIERYTLNDADYTFYSVRYNLTQIVGGIGLEGENQVERNLHELKAGH